MIFFKFADTNRSGLLSWSEYIKGYLKWVSRRGKMRMLRNRNFVRRHKKAIYRWIYG